MARTYVRVNAQLDKINGRWFFGERFQVQVRDDVSVEDRRRILRLIENMTMGRNAVGYLTESMHGAGSPQAQRVQIQRAMKLEEKKRLARKLAGVNDKPPSITPVREEE